MVRRIFRHVVSFTLGISIVLAGCSPPEPIASVQASDTPAIASQETPPIADSSAPSEAVTSQATAAEPSGADEANAAPTVIAQAKPDDKNFGDLTPVPIESGTVKLAPENTKIIFVGTHAGKKPDPRTGGFEKFTGTVAIDQENKVVKSVRVEIDTNSLWTQIPKLTTHLKSPDFFEVREYPTAKFESVATEKGQDGEMRIRGNLTLHGVTKEITIPAKVEITDQGLTVTSSFDFKRTDFGMNYGTTQVDDKVTITVVVGQKTQPSVAG